MSQLDCETKKIGDYTYKILMLDPLTSADILLDIVKTIAPAAGAFGAMFASKGNKTSISSILDGESEESGGFGGNPESIERAIVGLIDRLERDKLHEIIEHMAKVTSFSKGDNKWPELSTAFNIHFRGHTAEMFKWLGFALKVQYGSFFSSQGGGILHAVQEMAAAK